MNSAHYVFRTLSSLLLIALAGTSLGAEVSIEKAADGSHRAKGDTYEAVVDAAGDLVFLSSNGKEFLTTPTPHPDWVKKRGNDPVQINLTADLLAIRNEHRRVEYQFGPSTISVEHEGALPWFGLSPKLTGQVKKDGATIPAGKVAPDVVKLVHGGQAILLGEPMHTMRGLVPSKTTRGKKSDELFQYQIECGVAVTAADQVSVLALDGTGATPKSAPHFPKGTPPEIFAQLKNLSSDAVEISARFSVVDHHTEGREVFAGKQEATIPGGGEETLKVQIPVTEPGFYGVTMELLEGDAVAKRERLWFVVDPENYYPPLTRPADFDAFWAAQLQKARSVPLNPEVVRNESISTDAFDYFDVTVALLPGRKFKTGMLVPKNVTTVQAQIGFFHEGGDPSKGMIKQFERAESPQVFFAAPMPDEGSFRRWTSATDNNLLECYLITVRILDFVRSREGIEQIHLMGNSRSGPLSLVAGALSPEKVAAVHAHVPTSMGVSWTEKPYQGWGQAPAAQREAAAYVDPVNFAPDMKVPFWLDGGIDDGLSPCQGILAFYNYAKKAPWKRVAIERGGHGYFTSGNRERFLEDLSTHLDTTVSSGLDDRILREH